MQENFNLFHGNDKGADQSAYPSNLVRSYVIPMGTVIANFVKFHGIRPGMYTEDLPFDKVGYTVTLTLDNVTLALYSMTLTSHNN